MSKSILETIHETAKGFHDAGVMDNKTMREFDIMCLPQVKEYSANQIKQIRRRNKVSQGVFAAYLNTKASTVQNWEQGQKKPSGFALKLIDLVDRHGIEFLAV